MRLKEVVLPAPLGPITLTSSPSSTSKIEALDRGDAAEAPRQSLNFEQRGPSGQTAPSRPCGRKRISSSSATP